METTSRKQKAFISVAAFIVLAIVLSNVYLVAQISEYERNAELQLEVESGYCAHITIVVDRVDGTREVIKDGVLLNNAGTLTTIGKDWIEDQLGDSPSTDPAKWISVSADAGSSAVGWT